MPMLSNGYGDVLCLMIVNRTNLSAQPPAAFSLHGAKVCKWHFTSIPGLIERAAIEG
jgi:hypothetical protein